MTSTQSSTSTKSANTSTKSGPIAHDWTIDEVVPSPSIAATATAADVNALLARFEVADIGPSTVPYLAAAAAELALVSGIPWRFSADDAPVALLRLIAKVSAIQSSSGGPHTARLATHLGEHLRIARCLS